MSYRFEQTDVSVEAALRRIASEQLRAAAQALRGKQAATRGVHEARKSLKKTRALMRLLRHGLPVYPMENPALRDIGRSLGSLRDAHVTAGLVSRLCAEAGVPDIPPVATSADPGAEAELLQDAAQALADAAGRAETWHLRGDARRTLAKGLERTARAGQKALNPGLRGDDSERLHELRKRVKDRWYQARLFHDVWPEAMKVEADEAGNLAETLGDRHDLDAVAEQLGDAAPPTLCDLIAERSKQLLAEARPAARRLYAERPAAVTERLLGWWTLAGMPSG